MISAPASFRFEKPVAPRKRPLIYMTNNGSLAVAGNLYSVRPCDRDAERSLNAFVDILDQHNHELVIEPGTLIMFDNERVLHSRNEVRGDRWLQRAFSRRSLSALRQATGDSLVFSVEELLRSDESNRV